VALEAASRAGVVVGVGSCVQRGVLVAAGRSSGASVVPCTVVVMVLSVFVFVIVFVSRVVNAGSCEGTGVVPVDAGVRGAGVEERVWAGDGVGSLVRKHRSLSVSLGALATGAGGRSRCDCWKLDKTPLDSSDEVSLPSGVESESKRCRGERRFRVREA